ncbi:MAG: NUDIX domain-containing protein, partial [Prevotellaceae bacterium]|nr:NUDIX domain-containing protein [Prevotellaceae bacterium]
ESARREIMEETGLQVKNLRYCASQPWPYPSVLMVGYVATYESGELSLQRSELRKGQWFKRKALPQIPGKVSLARQLIDRWIEQKL